MRRILGTILTVLVLTATASCGEESSNKVVADPAPTATSTPDAPSEDPTSTAGEDGAVDFIKVALVSETATGGEVSERATPLADVDAVRVFAQQFEAPAMGTRLARKVGSANVPDGQALVGAVISIGCDVPPGVAVTQQPQGLSITPLKVTDPLQECFAAVTTVALVLVDASEVLSR